MNNQVIPINSCRVSKSTYSWLINILLPYKCPFILFDHVLMYLIHKIRAKSSIKYNMVLILNHAPSLPHIRPIIIYILIQTHPDYIILPYIFTKSVLIVKTIIIRSQCRLLEGAFLH